MCIAVTQKGRSKATLTNHLLEHTKNEKFNWSIISRGKENMKTVPLETTIVYIFLETKLHSKF